MKGSSPVLNWVLNLCGVFVYWKLVTMSMYSYEPMNNTFHPDKDSMAMHY